MIKRTFIILLCLFTALMADAQIYGKVTDASTGESVPFAGVVYRGHGIHAGANWDGDYNIERHDGWTLVFSAVGYKSSHYKIEKDTKLPLNIKLKPDTKQLDEVVVSGNKGKYSRKNNPAVELMKRVIAAKKQNKLENNDFYQYNKYQKITVAKNNVDPMDLVEMKANKKRDWITDQVELCPMNNALILPLQVEESVTNHIYRKSPHAEKDYVLGESSKGVATILETTGSMVSTTLKDIFTDVDIYDDQVRLLRFPFTSPISKDAINFYRFYIVDTLYVGKDQCIELSFVPNNQQDIGFRGDIYVLNDSSLHVRKVNLTIPKQSDVNFVETMKIEQEYMQLEDGQWVLDNDNMLVELAINKFMNDALVIRSTKYSDYSFDEIGKFRFRGKAPVVTDADSKLRGNDFWQKFRTVELTKSESGMDRFVKSITDIKGMKYLLFIGKAFVENYVETSIGDSVKSKFDIGPFNTIVNRNEIDGFRFRMSGRTTAALNPHWFALGYVARGMESKRNYYSGNLIYALNRKENQPWEFPVRQISFLSESDIMSPSDKFLSTNKDNVFTAFHVTNVDKYYFYNRQQIEFKYETDYWLGLTLGLKTEKVEGAMNMQFRRNDAAIFDDCTPITHSVRTTELHAGLRWAPGETYVNTKQRRYPINLEAPVLMLDYTMAFDNVLGGKYSMHMIEGSIYKRFWLKSWGKLDTYVAGGMQLDKVPFPLLFMPKTNLSYLNQFGTHTFMVMNNLEFLNDRYFMWEAIWDINGKLFNRIPLLKKLKWREVVAVRGMLGKTTDKNNPFLEENRGDDKLFMFPQGSHVMGKDPYVEIMAGVHNIFKLIEIDYVRRMTYRDSPDAIKWGLRFGLNFSF